MRSVDSVFLRLDVLELNIRETAVDGLFPQLELSSLADGTCVLVFTAKVATSAELSLRDWMYGSHGAAVLDPEMEYIIIDSSAKKAILVKEGEIYVGEARKIQEWKNRLHYNGTLFNLSSPEDGLTEGHQQQLRIMRRLFFSGMKCLCIVLFPLRSVLLTL
jgi:hypothetical protein